MIVELFPFQRQAVNDLRMRSAMAQESYSTLKVPQVVSLQAPTGSGKTLIMAALIEDIFFGTENFMEQPDAIFVWLSDSPQLNEQSRQKFEQKADRIRFDQLVTITDDSFDQELLEDGNIYFLNTQKIGKKANLSLHSDSRQYTIWEAIENTAREKSNRLYFIIDEAHRGMQDGKKAGLATTIMQRFIKGSDEYHLSPIPVVIGMSATAERFNALVGNTTSTLHKVVISPAQVRDSGLLKERIVITYPDDPEKTSDMAVLQAATEEWKNKCLHWYQYTYEQHYTNVNPVFVIQVQAGTNDKLSNTDLDDVIAKVEETIGEHFKENEVVHTFGSTGTVQINGLNVPYVEPSAIAGDRRIRVVLFKESLSTGWDCPRAETMMSFRHAVDATYIAQLLGRMIRTPLQCRVLVDDYLNDVRLYLPYFDKETVHDVVHELQSAEGGDIPTNIDEQSIEDPVYIPWTVHTKSRSQKGVPNIEGQIGMFNSGEDRFKPEERKEPEGSIQTTQEEPTSRDLIPGDSGITGLTRTVSGTLHGENLGQAPYTNQTENPSDSEHAPNPTTQFEPAETGQLEAEAPDVPMPDREDVIKFINDQGFLTYMVKSVRINSYLKSLLSLAGLLTQNMIFQEANDEVKQEVTDMMRSYIEDLHRKGKYEELAKQVLELKLSIQIFDVFGDSIEDNVAGEILTTTETDIDRQLRAADVRMGSYGFPYVYGRRFLNPDNPNEFKVDCILFAADEDCMARLNQYAEDKFHILNDQYRRYVVSKSEKCRKQYSDIVADGDIISKHNFTLPELITVRVEAGGEIYYDHLFADEQGAAQIKLNTWETEVLEEERKRQDFVCWLRNPPRQSWSLCIPYETEGETKSAYPDFLIFRKDPALGYVMDILEPHNPEFRDNLGKAKGFAEYAIEEPRIGRVQQIRPGKDPAGNTRLKRLDMSKGPVRNKVLAATSNDELDHIFDTDGEFSSEQ